MRNFALALLVLTFGAAVAAEPATKPADKAAPATAAETKLNTVCPFSGKTVDGKTTVTVGTTVVAVADKAAAEVALKTTKAEDVIAAAKANKALVKAPAKP